MKVEDAARARERMARARRAIEAARLLCASDQPEAAVNRAYYASFYAACALVATKGLDSRKHRGIIGMFDREFVLPGLVDRKHGRTLHELFQQRGIADYAFFVEFDEDAVEQLVSSATELVEAGEQLPLSLLEDE
ncbi:MAG: HEPN domain-containing protein [Armatimonadetes bacterium]|nr:HEPN domain-containing protein [Armatimonadota bacterium]